MNACLCPCMHTHVCMCMEARDQTYVSSLGDVHYVTYILRQGLFTGLKLVTLSRLAGSVNPRNLLNSTSLALGL